MAHEAIMGSTDTNGDLPVDIIEQTVTQLVAATDQARANRDALKADYDRANDLCTRLERAVRDLTAPKKQYNFKKRSDTEHKKVKAVTQRGDPNMFAPGQPHVAMDKQEAVLEALKSLDHTAGSRELGEVTGLSRQTVTSALAHLRHRGLIRYAGKMQGTAGHMYAPWDGMGSDEEATE